MQVTKFITHVNRTVLTGKTNQYIVLHYTGNISDSAQGNANYFRSVNRHSSAHYFVDSRNIYQVVEDKDSAWAVGRNYGSNNLFGKCHNKNSISIEMCSSEGKITDDTFNNTVELTKKLMKKYNIPADRVVRHYDVCSKKCPGWKGWLPGDESIWNKFKKAISAKSTEAKKSEPKSTGNFKVKVIDSALNIRKGPGTNYEIVDVIKNKGTFTITQTSGNWGKLKSGLGWINISAKYVKTV